MPPRRPGGTGAARKGAGGAVDWGRGRYEATAALLEPAAARVVAAAGAGPGQHVLDVACGTGNGVLAAARAGAAVTGLDAAERLVGVARERLEAEGLGGRVVVGDLHALPFEDRSFDVVVSVFGVIFTSDPARALGEVARVLRPGGRAALSAWIPAGAIHGMVRVYADAVALATGRTHTPFDWADPSEVTALAARHGLRASFADAALTFTAGSPEEYYAGTQADHPMSLAWGPLLARAGLEADVRAAALAALRAGNEDPAGFRVRVPYRIATLREAGPE